MIADWLRAVQQSRLTVRSALTPFLWLDAVVAVPCLLLAKSSIDTPLMWTFVTLGAVPIFATVVVGLYFAFKTPRALQSEEHEVRMQALQLVQGLSGPEMAQAVVTIANPYASTANRLGSETDAVQ